MKTWRSLLALVAAACLPTAMAEQDASRELGDVVERLNALDSWLDDAGKRLAAQQKQLANADREVASVAERIRGLSRRADDAESALAGLAAERARLDARRQEQTALIAEHLRQAWRFSRKDPLKAVLNQQDPAALQRMGRYHGYFAEARAKAVDELRSTLHTLEDNERRLGEERQTLVDARASVQREQTALVAERRKRQRLVRSLGADVSSKSKERERLESSRRRLAALVAELERQAERAGRVAGNGLGAAGDLPWPVEGRIAASFGDARAGGRMRWQGMVILAPLGADVRAVAAGEVIFADWLRGFGLLAIVDHGDNHMSLYGYADALFKRVGDRVEGGESIAAVGQSGGQSDVGLYFEIRQAGKPIDPRKWLQSRVN